MTATNTSRNLRVPVIAIVVVVLLVATILVYANPLGWGASTPQSVGTEPIPTTSSTTSTSSTTICTQTGIHGSLQVRVVSENSGTPVQGANVTATILDYCDSGSNQPDALGTTNTTGYAPNLVTWTGSVTVTVTYAGAEYTFTAQTDNQMVATLSIPSGLVVEKAIGCGGPFSCSLTTTTVTATSSLSVPPPTTTVVNYGCSVSKTSRSFALVNTSTIGNVNVSLKASPALTVTESACSYTHTNITTPVACGAMCGGGIGDIFSYSDVLVLNFSLGTPNPTEGYNLTISAGSGMSALFPLLGTQVYLNSQKVTTWYSNPPCSECMAPNATSITIELSAPVAGGAYTLEVSSTEYLVP
jgi:hypothetical protein